MAPDIKALLFDKDGTLFDFHATWSVWTKEFIDENCERDETKAALMGAAVGYDYAAEKFAPDSMVIFDTPPDIAAALLPFFDGENVSTLTDRLNAAAALVPQYPAIELRPFFQHLQMMDLHLGIATNDGEAPAKAHLEKAQVLEFFDFVAGSDSGYGGKPEIGMLMAFSGAIDVEPAQIAMVGDSAHDLVAGRNAGMMTIGVLTGVASEQELEAHADMIFPDIGYILNWLQTA